MEPDNANVTWRVYYPGGGLRVQTTTTDNLSYLVQDHLNSTAMTLNNSGAVTGEVIYSAWGEVRNLYGSTPTKKLFTGQYEAEAGLYFYNARWYDNQLGRFAQADIIIPELGNPLAWDRFTGMYDNPIRYSDPSGNITCDDNDGYGNCINYERKIYKAQTDLDVFVQPGQVNEIEMKIVGIWPFVDQVSPKEYDLLLNSNGNVDYLKLLKMFYLQQEALNKAAELFPEMALWNDRGDAFRHAYWSALMANEFDKNFALEFSTAHETSFSPYPNREEVFMDLNNNHVGLDIGVLIPKTSKVQLQKLILAALNEGRLDVWNGKNIYLSNLVPIN